MVGGFRLVRLESFMEEGERERRELRTEGSVNLDSLHAGSLSINHDG